MPDHYIYTASGQSDLNEGKGPMRTIGYFATPEVAIEAIITEPGQFKIMGVGAPSAQVDEIPVFGTLEEWAQLRRASASLTIRGTRLWGHRQDLAGNWGAGWVDNRDQLALQEDPEFQEYLRLKRKFSQ